MYYVLYIIIFRIRFTFPLFLTDGIGINPSQTAGEFHGHYEMMIHLIRTCYSYVKLLSYNYIHSSITTHKFVVFYSLGCRHCNNYLCSINLMYVSPSICRYYFLEAWLRASSHSKGQSWKNIVVLAHTLIIIIMEFCTKG